MANDEFREDQESRRQFGKAKQHEKRLENATYTAAEVKVLTETASKVALELGRREAQGEIAAMLEDRASQRAMRGTVVGVALLGMADTIRSMASQAARAASDATSVPSEGPGTSEMVGGSKEPPRRAATYPVDDDHPKGCLCPSCAKEPS